MNVNLPRVACLLPFSHQQKTGDWTEEATHQVWQMQ